MNKISDRRKLGHGQAMFSPEEEQSLFRANTSVTIVNSTPPSVEELKKTIYELEKALKNEKELRMEAQQNCKQHQIRTMMRQKEFHKILQESDKKIRSYVKENEATSVVKQIKKSYEEILRNFEYTNQATNTIIENKYKENISAMERRVDNIMIYMNEELMKTKMMSSSSINEVRREIEQCLNLAKKIEIENADLQFTIKRELHKAKLLEEERALLLDEVVNKKLIIARLVDDNKLLKRKIDQLAQSHSVNKSEQKLRQETQKLKTLSNSFVQFETKQTIVEKPKHAVFFGSASLPNRTTKHVNQVDCKLEHSRFSASSGKSTPKQIPNRLSQGSKLFNKNLIDRNNSGKGSQINYRKMQRRYGKKSAPNTKLFEEQSNQYMVTLANNDTINFESPEKDHNDKTVDHLRKCLDRERKKVAQLGKIVSKIQNRNEEVNQAIFNMLKVARAKCSEESGSLENLLKCQELLKLIADMKKRLSICESPPMQCGWGEIELQNLIHESSSV